MGAGGGGGRWVGGGVGGWVGGRAKPDPNTVFWSSFRAVSAWRSLRTQGYHLRPGGAKHVLRQSLRTEAVDLGQRHLYFEAGCHGRRGLG